MAHSSLRFGIGRFTTAAEVDFVVKHIISTVHRLREMRSVFFCSIQNAILTLSPVPCGKWFRKELISIRLTGLSISYFHPYCLFSCTCIYLFVFQNYNNLLVQVTGGPCPGKDFVSSAVRNSNSAQVDFFLLPQCLGVSILAVSASFPHLFTALIIIVYLRTPY
jgi:hypothetical protein